MTTDISKKKLFLFKKMLYWTLFCISSRILVFVSKLTSSPSDVALTGFGLTCVWMFILILFNKKRSHYNDSNIIKLRCACMELPRMLHSYTNLQTHFYNSLRSKKFLGDHNTKTHTTNCRLTSTQQQQDGSSQSSGWICPTAFSHLWEMGNKKREIVDVQFFRFCLGENNLVSDILDKFHYDT